MVDGTARVLDARECADLAEWIAGYSPRGVSAGEWEAIRPFILHCLWRLPHAGLAGTSRTARVLSRLALWATSQGLSLEPETVLDPDSVERFVQLDLADDRSSATYRSVLRRVGPLLTTKAPWEPRPSSVARRQVAQPYSSEEVRILEADVNGQRTLARRRAGRALLALGAGAGLDGRWVTRVGPDDLTSESGTLLVRVGAPAARMVPVRWNWAHEVAALAKEAGTEFLVGGRSTSRRRASHLVANLEVPPGHPKLSAARLRSTWLLEHLEAGTRLPELAAAAGLSGVTVLSDLLPHVSALPEADAHQLLRGV